MLTIVWDVDDVLNPLMKHWLECEWLPKHPSCVLTYADIVKNPPHELLNTDLKEYLESLDFFRFSDEGKTLPPDEELINWFRCYGRYHRHIALTATPIRYAPYSAAWVLHNFGEYIRTFAFVPSKRSNDPDFEYETTKKEYLQWWGKADVLIDDNPRHVDDARQLGVKSFLVPRPWNRAVGSVTEILYAINALSGHI